MTWQKCHCEQSEGIDDGQGATYCARCGGHSPNFIAHRFELDRASADRLDACLVAMEKIHRDAGENEFGMPPSDEEWDEYIYD